MPKPFSALIKQHEDSIIRAWADDIYRDRRTELRELLSYRQLVSHMPEILEELAHLLDEAASDTEIAEATGRVRSYAQIRFHQRVLIDEVARELMIFRKVFEDFLWREGSSATQGDLWDLRDALRRAHRFIDEMIAQAIVIYAVSLRPPVETRASVWPPLRRRRTDFPETEERS